MSYTDTNLELNKYVFQQFTCKWWTFKHYTSSNMYFIYCNCL